MGNLFKSIYITNIIIFFIFLELFTCLKINLNIKKKKQIKHKNLIIKSISLYLIYSILPLNSPTITRSNFMEDDFIPLESNF